MSPAQQESKKVVIDALEQPEILDLVARALPLFNWIESYQDALDGFMEFEPRNFLSCIRVSRLWHQVFMPHLWHYYFNYEMDPTSNPMMSREVFLRNFSLARRHMYASAPADQELIFQSEEEEKEKERELAANAATSTLSEGRLQQLLLQEQLRVPMPRHLWGLFIYNRPTEMKARLLVANAHQLRELHLQGDVPSPMLDIPASALQAMKSMSYLQELSLMYWKVSTEDLVQILEGCQDTLQILRLLSVPQFEISPRSPPSRLSSTMSPSSLFLPASRDSQVDPWANVHLNRVKELALRLDWAQSKTSVFLPRFCPNLEIIKLEMDTESDLTGLIRTVREFCPKLNSLLYKEGYSMEHERGYFPEPEVFRSLIEDCARPLDEKEDPEQPEKEQEAREDHSLSATMTSLVQKPMKSSLGNEGTERTTTTLCSLNITSKNGLDEAFTNSILVHAATLEKLYVRMRELGTVQQCARQIQRIMQSCPRLKTAHFHGLPMDWTWMKARSLFLSAPTTTLATTPESDTMATTSSSSASMGVAWACKGLQDFAMEDFSADYGMPAADFAGQKLNAEDKAQWERFEKSVEPWVLEEDSRVSAPAELQQLFLFIRSQSESLRKVALGKTKLAVR